LILSVGTKGSVYATDRPVEKVMIIVITSNRGLCGGFNAYVVKAANQLIREKYEEQAKKGNVSILAVGKKGNDAFRKTTFKVDAHNELWDGLTYDKVAAVAAEVLKKFADGEVDRVEVIYNRFKNAATQIITTEQVLPFKAEVVKPTKQAEKKGMKPDYIFEPSEEKILEDIIPYALKVRFYGSLLDSNAAEHGARMTAMHKATDNAKDLLKALRLSYNKARQAAITKEILEIVGGAEAINN
ncbi:MAG TPA: ATP synthase F1 subunit gamma, partial [Bacteroidia bacterium]|nr:ATP synthase F1 subunit gamma [Bacteroidia bacterium]